MRSCTPFTLLDLAFRTVQREITPLISLILVLLSGGTFWWTPQSCMNSLCRSGACSWSSWTTPSIEKFWKRSGDHRQLGSHAAVGLLVARGWKKMSSSCCALAWSCILSISCLLQTCSVSSNPVTGAGILCWLQLDASPAWIVLLALLSRGNYIFHWCYPKDVLGTRFASNLAFSAWKGLVNYMWRLVLADLFLKVLLKLFVNIRQFDLLGTWTLKRNFSMPRSQPLNFCCIHQPWKWTDTSVPLWHITLNVLTETMHSYC